MSKAFVSEEVVSHDDLPEEADPEGPTVITPEGHAKMVAEVEARHTERGALTEAIEAASGEVAKQEAERQRRLLDRRVRYLRRRLDVLEVVRPDEADAETGHISVAAPLAQALLGREAGDEVSVPRPKGKVKLSLQRVRYEPSV